MTSGKLYYLSAFTTDPAAGNPAGVWLGDSLPDANSMQKIAAEVGFSETAFVAPDNGYQRKVRYFSPEMEVPFCGHATIATGVLLGEENGEGLYHLDTAAGEIALAVKSVKNQMTAALTSVTPTSTEASKTLIDKALNALHWTHDDLDPNIIPARAYAGAWHLVLAANSKDRLDRLDYDFDKLKAIMLQENLTTLQLVWRENQVTFHSRNPFPVGGIVEDPATGAAAAALGGYLRQAGYITAPATILIRQGEAMGRPSKLRVEIPQQGGIIVSGTAVRI